MAVNFLTNVPKLKGRENYGDWAFAMQNLLELDELGGCIQGVVTDELKMSKAKAKLVLSIDTTLFIHIKEAKTAKEVWDRLKNLFDDSSFTRKIGLLRTLISIRLDDCDSMESYVNRIIETAQKLNNTGFKIGDDWIGSLLLAGLPDNFSPMIMAIEHSGIEITTDAIKTKLLDMGPMGKVSNTGNAFAGYSKEKVYRNVGNQKFAVKRNVKCFKCQQMGHYQNNCPNKKEKVYLNRNEPKGALKNAFSAVFLNGNFSKDDWYIDSGASVHLIVREEWLQDLSKETEVKEIMVANQEKVSVVAVGNVNITTFVGDKFHDVTVTNVVCVPKLTTNLLSVSQLIRNGNCVKFEKDCCKIYNKIGELVAVASLINNVYKLNVKNVHSCLFTTRVAATCNTWHRRFGHINHADLQKLSNGIVDGLVCKEKISGTRKEVCEVCCEGKQTRLPFKHRGTRATSLLEVIHADVCGPMETRSIGGSKYFLLFEDDYSRMTFVYFLKQKSEALDYFRHFKAMVENQTNSKIKIFRSDNGGEFCSGEFEQFFRRQGIIHQKTNPYTPEQNGLSERMNRTIVEKARCMIFDAKLDKKFWAEAVNTAVYLKNRSVTSSLGNKTPLEIWTGRKPDVSNLKIFGSPVMVHIAKAKRVKWDRKSRRMILVGYSDTTKGYRVYDPENNTVITSRDVIIIENDEDRVEIFIDTNANDGLKKTQAESDSVGNIEEESDSVGDIEEESDITITPVNIIRRSDRARKPKVFKDFVTYTCLLDDANSYGDPSTVAEALARPDGEQWKKAMTEELKSFEDNEAWDIVELPKSASLVDYKWVFKKTNDSENYVRYSARLVARGFTQKVENNRLLRYPVPGQNI